MLFALLISFGIALTAPWVYRVARDRTGLVLAAVPLGLFAYFASFLPDVTARGAITQVVPWVPSFGVNASFHLDGLSLLFALLITGLGSLVVVYAGGYLKGNRDLGRFYLALLLFMSAMLGLVLSSNLIVLFVFWELTSFASYLLIGFKHEDATSRTSALQALLVTGVGGLALLGGFLLLASVTGTFELSEIRMQGEFVREHGLYAAIFGLIALGAFTKSAQFPFHFWLPNAMAAPTPVSAYLHSATMVKAGIYLLMRLDSLLGGTGLWIATLSVAGGITMLIGAVWALRQTDVKKVLAYSTITALGTLTLLVGLSFEASIVAAVVFLLVHALYKGALFLVAGSVDHETGTRDVRALGGLRRVMPWTAGAGVIAGLSMAGLPPLFGFVGKELAYKAKIGFEGADLLLPGIAVVANALTVVAAGLLVVRPFFGTLRTTPKTPHEAPWTMWAGPLVLAGVGLLFGLVPGLLPTTLVTSAVSATLGEVVPVKLALWYGLDTALVLSVLTMTLGVAAYLTWDRLHGVLARLDGIAAWGPERGYFGAVAGMLRVATWQTSLLNVGGLRGALVWLVGLVTLLPAVTLWTQHAGGLADVGTGLRLAAWGEVLPHEWALAALVVLGAGVAVVARSRTLIVAALGVIGFAVALVFLGLGAPDLAMTQLLVETLIVVIILLVLRHLPLLRPSPTDGGLSRAVTASIAVAAGGVVTGLALVVGQTPFDASVSQFYAERSVPEGFGRNLVNVILVDFRALDTLGEIVVLAVAALGAHVLVQFDAVPSLPRIDVQGSLILAATTRFMITLLVLAALFLLWRGHNEPGGGFIGGLVAAGAFALYLIAFGQTAMRRLLRVEPRDLISAGLAVAVASGLVALLAHDAFMTGQWLSVTLGSGGEPLKLGTPLLFDVGVFLVVIGFTLTILLALEQAPAPGRQTPTEEQPIPGKTSMSLLHRTTETTARGTPPIPNPKSKIDPWSLSLLFSSGFSSRPGCTSFFNATCCGSSSGWCCCRMRLTCWSSVWDAWRGSPRRWCRTAPSRLSSRPPTRFRKPSS